jgi:hypothetical protein
MALNLLKLAVGPASIGDLVDHIERRRAEMVRLGQEPRTFHTTRMVPKRKREIAGKGSIFWVIKGTLLCRQAITAIEPFTGTDGIGRCHLVLDPEVRAVVPRPCRPFQGWRYLTQRDAPKDLDHAAAGEIGEMPEELRRELAALGLI